MIAAGSVQEYAKPSATLGFDEMARDEARHGKTFEGLLKRYFGK